MTFPLAVFIDGGYLQSIIHDEFRGARIDYQLFINNILAIYNRPHQFLRTYYYDCLPYQSGSPTQKERDMFAGKQSFFDALDYLPFFTVKQGRLAFRGYERNGKPILQQKEVDVLLAVDLVKLSMRKTISQAILIAGDSDFLPAVKVAQEEGVQITLVHGDWDHTHTDLIRQVDHRIQISQDIIMQSRQQR